MARHVVHVREVAGPLLLLDLDVVEAGDDVDHLRLGARVAIVGVPLREFQLSAECASLVRQRAHLHFLIITCHDVRVGEMAGCVNT